jgi:hypothetical protein
MLSTWDSSRKSIIDDACLMIKLFYKLLFPINSYAKDVDRKHFYYINRKPAKESGQAFWQVELA